MIYFDYAATTPVRREVAETIQAALTDTFGNPSGVYGVGRHAKSVLTRARREMADTLGVRSEELYFTGGATEGDNWAIRSQAAAARAAGRGNRIVATAIEHPAVAETLAYLETTGFTVTYVAPQADGGYRVADFIEASTPETIGWVAMAVNNETGDLLPIVELGKAAKERGIWFHVDTVQAVGRLGWDFSQIPCTSFVGSAHKLYGPKGVGFMVYRPWENAAPLPLQPLMYGGGQERGLRSGTENVPYIAGMAQALRLAYAEAEDAMRRDRECEKRLCDALVAAGGAAERNGGPNCVPYIISLWLPGIPAVQAVIQADLAGLAISAGSACSAGSVAPSRVLSAYYPDAPARASESIRLSFGRGTDTEAIDAAVKFLIALTRGAGKESQ